MYSKGGWKNDRKIRNAKKVTLNVNTLKMIITISVGHNPAFPDTEWNKMDFNESHSNMVLNSAHQKKRKNRKRK